MVNTEKQVKKSCNTNFSNRDLHIILVYRKETEPETVKDDILLYLRKVRTIAEDNIEYCYIVNQIMDKYPAIHILIRTKTTLNQEELKRHWDKGMAKASTVSQADKRAMDYYLTKWGSKTHYSGGFK